jgi:hypothetical protein
MPNAYHCVVYVFATNHGSYRAANICINSKSKTTWAKDVKRLESHQDVCTMRRRSFVSTQIKYMTRDMR